MRIGAAAGQTMAVTRRPVQIAPSILSADYALLAEEIARVRPESDLLHVDVMDGHFVPNLTIGPPVVASIHRHTDLFLDCHLMVDNPGLLLKPLAEAGAGLCSVHIELGDPRDLFEEMRSLGLQVGLVVNPETPIDAALPYLEDLDLLLVMSVHPGRGGQSFIPEALPKLEIARRAVDEGGLDVLLQIDGGIKIGNAGLAWQAGADILVAGSAIFEAEDPLAAAAALREAAMRPG
jgi:ribulose-phosphate 3-epimerase